MMIEIRDDLFYKLVDLMKNRNSTIYNELKEIKPIAAATNNTLQQARELKTKRVKQSIKETIKELLNKNISPTKYKINCKNRPDLATHFRNTWPPISLLFGH